MTKPKLPVDIYTRVSRKGSREHLTSPQDQEKEARRFAQAHGLKVGEVLHDADKSGGTLARPALQEALRRIRDRESGGIVVAYLSRASRDTRQGLSLLDEITRAGGVLFAPNLPDYTTADGRMTTTIQLAIDAGYRERKTEELERAKENAIANGIPIQNRAQVGYRPRSKRDRRLKPDPRVAPIVREAFERRAAGEGPAALCRFLDSKKVRTSQGGRWTKPAVYTLLSSRAYLGELSYGLDRRYVNPTAHEPIVDLALWQAAQHPNGRRLAPARSVASEFLLTGVARCAGCGYCLQATTSSHGHRIYRCTRTHAGGTCSSPVRVRAEGVEEAVAAAFWQLTDDLEAEGQTDDSGELAQLEKDLARAERALTEWTSSDVQEAIGDLAEYAAGLRERRVRRDTLAEQVGRLRADEPRKLPDAQTLRKAWERMNPQERRELIGLRFDCLALSRDGSIVVYPAGTAPDRLPRRGFTRAPTLAPFPDPPSGARVLAL
jgi:site-specific DNA recombinase